MPKINLLLIEDEEAIRDMLRFALAANEFNLTDADTIAAGMKALNLQIPDLIILDWMLPDKSGLDFIQWIKQQDLFSHIPIIMLTAKAEEENKIKGLMTGADDYVTKPFSPEELSARIKAILRRGTLAAPNGEIKISDLILNQNKCQVHAGGQLLDLAPLEFKMLHFFMRHPDKMYTRDQLITHVWGNQTYINDRTIDVHIRRLRNKLKPYGHHVRIKTIRSQGYCFAGTSHEKK
jgi:two-component system phosphate regulon response regulator PhoB